MIWLFLCDFITDKKYELAYTNSVEIIYKINQNNTNHLEDIKYEKREILCMRTLR